MADGISLVIDNTNPRSEDRSKYIKLENSFGYEITGIQFATQMGVALKRSALRKAQKEVPVADFHLMACCGALKTDPLWA